MTQQEWVTYASLTAGLLCFTLYAIESVVSVLSRSQAGSHVETGKNAFGLLAKPDVTVDDVTKLLEAISKLTESLTKAGPALTSLIGAILFFAIAAFSSGALHGSPPPLEKPAPAAAVK